MKPQGLATIVLLIVAPRIARAGQVFYVSAQGDGAVYRLEDVNGDDDALDVGERIEGDSIGEANALWRLEL